MPYNKLSKEEKHVIEKKGTERPYSGEYDDFYKEGIYICRKCNNPLFDSKAKFDAKCGWPSFDQHYKGAVKWADHGFPFLGKEITCANCKAHLGHVFEGEHLTDKNTRHCVNSLSIRFVPKAKKLPPVLKS